MLGPRYCGQNRVLIGYGHHNPTPRKWAKVLDAIREHRTTCITCTGRRWR